MDNPGNPGVGDALASFAAGSRLEAGAAGPRHLEAARRHYRSAATAGHAPAMTALAKLLDHKFFGNEADRAEATTWLLRAAHAGDADGMVGHAHRLEQVGNGEARLWVHRAAEAGQPEAQTLVAQALLLENGDDDEEALALLEHAASAGWAAAHQQLAVLCLAADDMPGAREHLEAVAAAGEAQALWHLASDTYWSDRPEASDAAVWARRAADAGLPEAVLQEAQRLVETDEPRAALALLRRFPPTYAGPALRLMFQAELATGERPAYAWSQVEGGLAAAQVQWAERERLEGRAEAAFAWLSKAALQGDAEGQAQVATLLLKGEGCTRSFADAIFWARRAAAQGHAGATTTLSTLLLEAENEHAFARTPFTDVSARARSLRRLAAARGEPSALVDGVIQALEGEETLPLEARLAMLALAVRAGEHGGPLLPWTDIDAARAFLKSLCEEEGLVPPAALALDAFAAQLASEAGDPAELLEALEPYEAALIADEAWVASGGFGPDGMPPDGPREALAGTRLQLPRPGGFEAARGWVGFDHASARARLIVRQELAAESALDALSNSFVPTPEDADVVLAQDAWSLDGWPVTYGRVRVLGAVALEWQWVAIALEDGVLVASASYPIVAADALAARIEHVLRAATLSPEAAPLAHFTCAPPPGFEASTRFAFDLPYLLIEPLAVDDDASWVFGVEVYEGEQHVLENAERWASFVLGHLDCSLVAVAQTDTTRLDGAEARQLAGSAITMLADEPWHFACVVAQAGTRLALLVGICPQEDVSAFATAFGALVASFKWTAPA